VNYPGVTQNQSHPNVIEDSLEDVCREAGRQVKVVELVMDWGSGTTESDSPLMMHTGDTRGKGGRVQYSATEELGSDAMGGYSLEDYIYSLEARGGGANNTANIHSDTDVYGQLQQKERDLILAAELGKALLEKNEELKLGQTWPEIIEGGVSPVTGAVTRELVIIQRYNEYKPKIGRHCEQAAVN